MWAGGCFRLSSAVSRAGYSHMAMLRMFIKLDGGNTSNLKQVLDSGPEGGATGGQLIAEGTPNEIMKIEESYTGQCLATVV